jgi:hypothetical protein
VVFIVAASVAVKVTAEMALTFLWLTLNVSIVLPDAIVTVAGGAAAVVSELASLTTIPPGGAGPAIVTVPVTAVDELPLTDVGVTVTDTSVGVTTVRLASAELDP